MNTLLDPVWKARKERVVQTRMEAFLTYRERFAKIKSSRLQRAVRGIAPDGAEPLMLVTTAAKEPKLSSKREARVVKGKKGKTPNQVPIIDTYIPRTLTLTTNTPIPTPYP